MTLRLTNVDENMFRAIKSVIKFDKNVKCKVEKEAAKSKKECVGSVRRALEEIKNGEVVRCKDFDEFRRQMLS